MALYEQLSRTRTDLESVVSSMLSFKSNGDSERPLTDDAVAELRELSTQASVSLMLLRRLNREILIHEDRVKQETEAARAPVESTSLKLHNLQYEVEHHLRAIAACESFQTRWPDIELVSAQEFFRDAPESLRLEDGLAEKPHRLEIMRLNYELHQRKELVRRREMLEIRRRTLQESVASRRRCLSSLPAQLQAVKQAAQGVQQVMGGSSHAKRIRQHRLAPLLPPPLFILFSQLSARRDMALQDPLSPLAAVDIAGSEEEAQAAAAAEAAAVSAAVAAAAAAAGGRVGEGGEARRGEGPEAMEEEAGEDAAPAKETEEGEAEDDDDDAARRRHRSRSRTENSALRTPPPRTPPPEAPPGAPPAAADVAANDDGPGAASEETAAETATVLVESLFPRQPSDAVHPLAVEVRLRVPGAPLGAQEAAGGSTERGAAPLGGGSAAGGDGLPGGGKPGQGGAAAEGQEGRATGQAEVLLRFEFWSGLGVVAVAPGEQEQRDWLVNLFPGDYGEELPNLATLVAARHSSLLLVPPSLRPARPFLWAQHLAGIDFLPPLPPSLQPPAAQRLAAAEAAEGLQRYGRQQRVEAVLRQLQMRCAARRELQAVLSSLSACQVPTPPPSDPSPWPSDGLREPKCHLVTWQLAAGPLSLGSSPNLNAAPSESFLSGSSAALPGKLPGCLASLPPGSSVFRLVLQRDVVPDMSLPEDLAGPSVIQLHAQVGIASDFPLRPASFVLRVWHNGTAAAALPPAAPEGTLQVSELGVAVDAADSSVKTENGAEEFAGFVEAADATTVERLQEIEAQVNLGLVESGIKPSVSLLLHQLRHLQIEFDSLVSIICNLPG